MPTLDDYMRGRTKASLKAENVSPKWMKSPPLILELTNKAFKLYHDAWKGLGNASQRVRTKIEIDLTDAARTGVGYGMFPGDLESVFQHLIDNNNHWTSDSGSNYCGPQVTGAINLPDGITNFLNAVDQRGNALKLSYAYHLKYLENLAIAKKNNRWDEIGKWVERIEKNLWWGTPSLWFTSISANQSLTDYHGRFSKWNDGFGTVQAFLNTFNQYNLGVGTTKPQAAAIATLTTLIKKFVPILGDAYAKAFEALPGAIKWARNVREEEDRKIRQILGAGNW
ncbi:MAG: hypothetical protein R2747_05160 [Pyrinomonadaceae bacterium]